MAQEQVMDLIDHACELHARLSEYYDELSKRSGQDRVKILLNYLSESEARHEKALAEYEHDFASADVTDTWYQFKPDLMEKGKWIPENITPEMDADAVLRVVLRIDDRLSELYREIIKRAHSKRIRDVFTNLLDTNEKEKRNLARDFAHMSDW